MDEARDLTDQYSDIMARYAPAPFPFPPLLRVPIGPLESIGVVLTRAGSRRFICHVRFLKLHEKKENLFNQQQSSHRECNFSNDVNTLITKVNLGNEWKN